MNRSELLQETVDALHDADFEVYWNEGLRKYFDLIGVKDFKVFVKVLMNIDNLGALEGGELHRFSDAFSSQSLVVGERAGMEPLKDDVVYQRHGNPCMNPPTLRRVLKGESVSRFTKRGQLLVGIDGGELKKLREERGLSQEDLARVLGCTGQTVYRIEKRNCIQEDQFEKLLDYFGKDVRISGVELKEPSGRIEMPVSDPLKKEIVKEYFRLKLGNTPLQTLDFALKEKPILTPVSRTEAELRSKQRVVKGLEEALGCGAVHITRERRRRRMPSISFEELHCIVSKREILERSEES